MLLPCFPKLHRRRVKPRLTSPPTPPPGLPVHVVEVQAYYGFDTSVWHFDRPVVILPGATFEMFRLLPEGGGADDCIGVSGVMADANRLVITMDHVPIDTGNGWFWGVDFVPAKVVGLDGGLIVVEGGDVNLVDPPG